MIFEVLWHLTKAINCCQYWIFYCILQTLKRTPIVSVKIPWSTRLVAEKCSLNTVSWSHIICENSRLSDRALLAKWKPASVNNHKEWLWKCLVQIPVAKGEKPARAQRLSLQGHQLLSLLWLCTPARIPPTLCNCTAARSTHTASSVPASGQGHSTQHLKLHTQKSHSKMLILVPLDKTWQQPTT